MSHDNPTTGSGDTGARGTPAAVPPGMTRMSDHWGLLLAVGLVTVGLGLILAVWPESTLVVLAVLLAIQLIVTGIFRIVTAIAASGLDGGLRALLGLAGALALIVGLLFLREPLQTLVVVGLLVGVWWVVSGVIDIFGALFGDGGARWSQLAMGALSLVAGAFIVVNPEISLGAFVILACVWLFGYGFIEIVAALQLRSVAKARSEPDRAVAGGIDTLPGATAGGA